MIVCLTVALSPCHHVAPSSQAADKLIDSPMYRDPVLPKPTVVNGFPDGLLELWLKALERSEADYRMNAALAIVTAHERGLKGLETAVARLTRELGRADQHPAVRLAAVRALVALDARGAAAQLLNAATDFEMREIIDPALARWNYNLARAGWLERLGRGSHGRSTILAIQALGTVKEEKAVAPLRDLVLNREEPPAVRIEAARALAELRRSGGEDDATRLAAENTPVGRLAAASLLRRHEGDAAVRLLQSLARDAEPAVASVALARLIEIDAKLVEPMLDAVLASADAGVREHGVEVLLRQPSDEHLKRLSDRLSDVHPKVRIRAREALRELAGKAEWREPSIREGARALAGDDWRGQEQAALLLALIDHKPAGGRLVELLSSPRPEVCVAAAWALRKLAVSDTLPGALDYFRRTFAAGITAGDRKLPTDTVDHQLCQLAQLFGVTRYRPASEALAQLIPPKATAGFEARAAAIWALGRIHEGRPGAPFAGALAGRIAAVRPFDVEDSRVRRMSAVALGLIKEQGALGTLREFYRDRKASPDVVNNACGWAIEQITGEKVPAATVTIMQRDWFLTPAR